jgi:initiation factor 1A
MSSKKAKQQKGRKLSVKHYEKIDVKSGEGYYGVVEKILGDNKLNVKCNDGVIRQAIIPGRFYKRVWMKIGSKIVLNIDCEVVQVLNENDKIFAEADKMMKNSKNSDNNIFYEGSDEEDEDEDEDEEDNDNMLRKMEIKTNTKILKNEKDKIKDIERKNGKIIRDDDVIQKELNIDDI